jgi:hypothetical protein
MHFDFLWELRIARGVRLYNEVLPIRKQPVKEWISRWWSVSLRKKLVVMKFLKEEKYSFANFLSQKHLSGKGWWRALLLAL